MLVPEATAKAILTNLENIRFESYCDKETGQWIGSVHIYEGNKYCYAAYSTSPSFESDEKALLYVRSVVEEIQRRA